MPRVTIPDTSCLIGLAHGNLLDVLRRLFPEVLVPRGVASEFGEALPGWACVVPVDNTRLVQVLRLSLGLGESEVIALALEHRDAVAVLDDVRARRTARELGVRFTGTAGLLLKAKASGHISSVARALDTMTPSGSRLSDELRREVLRIAGEEEPEHP